MNKTLNPIFYSTSGPPALRDMKPLDSAFTAPHCLPIHKPTNIAFSDNTILVSIQHRENKRHLPAQQDNNNMVFSHFRRSQSHISLLRYKNTPSVALFVNECLNDTR